MSYENWSEEQKNSIVAIVAKLSGLGVTVPFSRFRDPIDGPIVTGYPIVLPDSIPLAKIINKEEDFALALGVESVDIRRVSGEIIIFVPNKNRRTVQFLDILQHYIQNETLDKNYLPLPLGVDFRGNYAYLELAKMPHVLMAGATGSGKSILESAICASISTKYSPEELRLYLVDTKRLDLALFEKLPHVDMVAKSAEDYYAMWNRIWKIHEARQMILEKKRVRNIQEFNKVAEYEEGSKMPFIVCIIDELADLMAKDQAVRDDAKDDDENEHDEPKVIDSLSRILQVSRATGIHFICCTQRTSVDIVKGKVKTNLPCRISLRVPTGTDSRVILDAVGAENLLGRGDMLIKYPEEDEIKRFHGPFVRLEDIEAILRDQKMIVQMFRSLNA